MENLDAGIATGTVFGVYASPGGGEGGRCFEGGDGDTEDIDGATETRLLRTLVPAENLILSGYCMYSSSTMLVFTTGDGVNAFTLDSTSGSFMLTHPDVTLAPRGGIFSFNEANILEWGEPLQNYVRRLKEGEGQSGKRYSGRYIGSRVADVHRTLLYGGVFGMPADAARADGQVNLVTEAAPFAFLVEQAGGKASSGRAGIMEITPQGLTQRTPLFVGSAEDVTEIEGLFVTPGSAAASGTTTGTG